MKKIILVFLNFSLLFILSACSGNFYNDYYVHDQYSPTPVGQTAVTPELINCDDDTPELIYRIYTGKGYDPIGHAVFTYDRSFLQENTSQLFAQATNVYADIVTYTVRPSHKLNEGHPTEVEMLEYRAIFWQKGTYSPQLGGEVRTLTEGEAAEFGVSGILVTAIRRGAAGFKGDVRVGDIILEVNDLPVANLELFRNLITKYRGQTVKVKLFRNGELVTLNVSLESQR